MQQFKIQIPIYDYPPNHFPKIILFIIILGLFFKSWLKENKIQEEFPLQALPNYLYQLLINPIEVIDWFMVTLIFVCILMIVVIQWMIKSIIINLSLSITPEKIYWSIYRFKVYTVIQKYNLATILFIKPYKIFNSSQQFSAIQFTSKHKKTFSQLDLSSFSEENQTQIIELCQQYYGLNINHPKERLFSLRQDVPSIILYLVFAVVLCFAFYFYLIR
ncbi:hypothetical protein QSV37_11785 [Acinetobacter sp. VNK23]|uniref:hypothetical protein n=1 Tax=Acinetobacter thutiue TaxID=2998078 RepID=UPI0025756E48|nr:hypothetical protein [Acinetobacter thutiue]MDM1020973.1 hypothetical protein [Acinetobacter thutiue]